MPGDAIAKQLKTEVDEEIRRELMEELYRLNVGVIRKTIRPYTASGMDEDDAMQEAYIATVRAVKHFRPEAGPFAGCLAAWVKATVGRAWRETSRTTRLPSHLHSWIYQYNRACDDIRKEGREPTSAELEKVLGLTSDQLETVRKAIVPTTSLSSVIGEDIALVDAIPDDHDDIGDMVEQISSDQDASLLWAAVDSLEEKNAEVIRYRYRDGLTLKDTAERIGVSLPAVKSREKRACQCLRRDREVKRIAADRGFTSAIFHGGLRGFKNTGESVVERAVLRRLEREGL